ARGPAMPFRFTMFVTLILLTSGALMAEESAELAKAREEIKSLGGQIETDNSIEDRPSTSIAFPFGSKFGDKSIPLLKSFPSLTSLYVLCQEKMTDAGIAELVKIKSLTSLALIGTDVTDRGLKILGKLKDLTSLDISGSPRITDAGIREFRNLAQLREL